jgi:FdhE protein
VPTFHSDTLWLRARARWAEITAHSPDLAPAVALQQRLLRLMIDAASALEEAPPALGPAARITGKWGRGVPALRNEIVVIPPRLKQMLGPLCTALADGGAGESALHIGDAIAAGNIDADSLLSVSLARNQKAIRTSALHMGFSPDLVWLIGELGSAPLAHHLASSIVPRSLMDDRRSTIEGLWDRGYCPLCGSWPAFIESRDGAHELRCSYCALAWSLTSHRCVYCGNDSEDFLAAAHDVNAPQRRVDLCGRCSGYTKVIEVRERTPFPLLAIEDLATLQLDEGAMERGYRRPELFDLDTIEPGTSTC